MFPSTEKYTQSDKRIKNNTSQYITHQKCTNIFQKSKMFEKNKIRFLFLSKNDFKMISVLCWFFIALLIFLYFLCVILFVWIVRLPTYRHTQLVDKHTPIRREGADPGIGLKRQYQVQERLKCRCVCAIWPRYYGARLCHCNVATNGT